MSSVLFKFSLLFTFLPNKHIFYLTSTFCDYDTMNFCDFFYNKLQLVCL